MMAGHHGELTQAALGTVLKTAGTVRNRVGIDTSALRKIRTKCSYCLLRPEFDSRKSVYWFREWPIVARQFTFRVLLIS